jgi:hypothetical protein
MTGTKKLILAALAALTLLAVPWGSARAQVIVRGPYPPRYYYRHRYYRPAVIVTPAPVYVAPRAVGYSPPPVYVAPRPVIVSPPPVVVTPAPTYLQPAPTYVQPAPVAPSTYPYPY